MNRNETESKEIKFFNSKAKAAIPGKFAKHYEKDRNNNKGSPRAALSHNVTAVCATTKKTC